MRVLTIIGQDRPGLMAKLTAVLDQAHIEILDFNAQVVGETVVASFQVESYRKAFRLLSDEGYRVVSHENVLVRLQNLPGALAELSRSLAQAGVDVRGMHIVSKNESACIVALEPSNWAKAREVLADRLVLEDGAG